MRQLIHIDEELSELIPGFLKRKREDVDLVRVALTHADFNSIARLAHRIKGEGGSYGFDGISAIGLAMETAAKAADVHGIQRGLNALCEYLDNVDVEFVSSDEAEPLHAH